jgi:hypothetical protein
MSEILLASGRYYSLVYDQEIKKYGYTRDSMGIEGRGIPWIWADSIKELRKLVGGF